MLADGPAETLLKRGHNAEHVEKRSVGRDLQAEIYQFVEGHHGYCGDHSSE